MKFGGAASPQQLTWLRQQLSEAKEMGQQAIVCCHLPLHPDTCPGACLLWNYEEALDICREAENVVATLSGHAHQVSPSPIEEHAMSSGWAQKQCVNALFAAWKYRQS